jgi:hypothetical protein
VGDQDDGDAEARREGLEVVLHPAAGEGVEGAEGLVHEQERRVRGQGPRHTDPLALAAGEVRRPPPADGVGVELHQAQQLHPAVHPPRLRPAQQARHEPDVVEDGQVGKESALLDDVADAPPQRDEVLLCDRRAVDDHAAG